MRKDILIMLSFIGVVLVAIHIEPLEGMAFVKDTKMSSQDGKAEFFCGYCHTLTYPKVMKKAYTSWKAGKHKDVGCVKCHYPPERLEYSIPQHKRISKDERYAGEKNEWEFMRNELEVLSRLTTIQNMDAPFARTKPRIDDLSCMSTKCHPSTGAGKKSEYFTKKINFAEYQRADKSKGIVQFVHDKHFDSKKRVEGQEMHCTTCHARETEAQHFEVSKAKCFLCHFKNTKFNKPDRLKTDRAKCVVCHKVPTRPLQSQKKEAKPGEEGKDGEKAITHKTLEEAKVSCQSCHLHLIRGKGIVSKEKCLSCHDNEKKIMRVAMNLKLMHEEHVAKQAAACFDCHQPIKHNKNADYVDTVRENCTVCHPDHHLYQRILLTTDDGPDGVQKTPSLMDKVTTNCMGCHLEAKIVKGETVLAGSGKSCAACHTKKHEGMPKQWIDQIKKNLVETKVVEREAQEAIKKAESKRQTTKVTEAKAMLKKGRQLLQIVEFGGGVHNQKYSMILLDEAFGTFDDIIILLSEE